jgi:hypothetical protein
MFRLGAILLFAGCLFDIGYAGEPLPPSGIADREIRGHHTYFS